MSTMRYSYRKLFSIPGAIQFCAAALLGRLPAGMIGLAIILPLSKLTHSYTIAGTVAAFTMIGMALSAPFSGRLIDRYGQGKILLIFALLNLIWTSALMACVYFGVSLGILCLIGALAGASRLSTGTLSRTRWAYVTKTLDPSLRKSALQAAYAFESIIDEIVFISAPILVTLLCINVHPLAGLLCCLVAFVSGAVSLAIQRRTQPLIASLPEKQSSAMSISGLQIMFAAVLFIGMSAGAVEVIVVARLDALGSRPLTGLLLATLSLSSMLSGFWYGARSFKLSEPSLWIRCMGLLVAALVPFVFAEHLIILTLTLFIAGLAIAPTVISGQVLTERILPTALKNEGMSIVVTAMIFGMAFGGWLSGMLIDIIGVQLTGMLPAMATFMAFVFGVMGTRSLMGSLASVDA